MKSQREGLATIKIYLGTNVGKYIVYWGPKKNCTKLNRKYIFFSRRPLSSLKRIATGIKTRHWILIQGSTKLKSLINKNK